MSFDFAYHLNTRWPSLAWLAVCELREGTVQVSHGPGVECHRGWFCEAVWDAPFKEGDFDRTDLVFGSGARCRDESIVFVSAGSTVDRLHYSARGERVLVSNSLPCLLEAINAKLEPSFRGYAEFFETITRGIDNSSANLPLRDGAVQLVYHHNLNWDGKRLQTKPKPAIQRNFARFENYAGFIQSRLKSIGRNMTSKHRARPWSWLGTVSQGYDSAASSLLARGAGLRHVITFDESRPGISDSGSAVAHALGLEATVVNRLAWQARDVLEPLFLVADGQGKEIMLAGAPVELANCVLVTGSAGDTAWSTNPAHLGSSLARSYHAGLSITEYRLHRGFIQLPVPFMGLRQLSNLVSLSRSAELAPWDVGGPYSRPIPRRLLEEAGVARDLFGITKTGASIRFLIGQDPWSPAGRHAFVRWLGERCRSYGVSPLTALAGGISIIARDAAVATGLRQRGIFRASLERVASRLSDFIRKRGLNDLAFAWAVELVRKSYPAP